MTSKSEGKRELILKRAREVFAARGFKAVTMQDIVDACQISRGGLYLYFSSTRELFLAVLDGEKEPDNGDAVMMAMQNDATAGDLLALFLKEQKKAILKHDDSLALACFEYFATYRTPDDQNPLKSRFNAQVQAIDRLIRNGIRTGEFVCDDPESFSRSMMYMIEGLKYVSHTTGLTQDAVDRELLYLLRNILPEE